MTERNRDLFYKIADAIEQTHRWSQQEFVSFSDDDLDDDGTVVRTLTQVEVNGEELTCGTSHCVAGWAVAIAKPELLKGRVYDVSFGKEAEELLGLDEDEAWTLFFTGRWIDGGDDLDRDAWTAHPDDETIDAAAERLREIGDGGPIDLFDGSKEALD